MLSNQIGPEVKNLIGNADPTRADYGFGLGLAVQTTPGIVRMAGSVGNFSWPGASGTNWWADPREDMAVVFMAQTPGPNPLALPAGDRRHGQSRHQRLKEQLRSGFDPAYWRSRRSRRRLAPQGRQSWTSDRRDRCRRASCRPTGSREPCGRTRSSKHRHRRASGSARVTFAPGARTAWHTHPLGQTLHVVAGHGLVQRWDGPIRAIRPEIRCGFRPAKSTGTAPVPTARWCTSPCRRRSTARRWNGSNP